MKHAMLLSASVFLMLCGSCTPHTESLSPTPVNQPNIVLSSRADWQKQVKDAAAKYKSWVRVSDFVQWAPARCSPPLSPGLQLSDSGDTDNHGGKLYFLYAAKDREYPHPSSGEIVADQPLGQVVVKESFHAQLCTDAEAKAAEEQAKTLPPDSLGQRRVLPENYAWRTNGSGRQTYKAGPAADLFMMFKTEPSPGTDRGWVYATVSPAGEITSLGRVESCMECHAHAKFDRLFGPAYARTPNSPMTPP